MGLFGKRDIRKGTKVYHPGDEYISPKLVGNKEATKRWFDGFRSYENANHIVEPSYTNEIAVISTFYDHYYMTSDPGTTFLWLVGCWANEKEARKDICLGFHRPSQICFTLKDVDQSRTHCSVVSYVKVPTGYKVALAQDGKPHLFDSSNNVCAISTVKMFENWWDIDSPLGHIGTQSVGKKALVSSYDRSRDKRYSGHKYIELFDKQTGEYWIDIDTHTMPQSIAHGVDSVVAEYWQKQAS